ncbi:MAG: type II toxin-antitoxin system YafQ family toxin [Bdellovibrionales bacterium]
MKTFFAGNAFRKDLKLAAKRGKATKKLQSILDLLLTDEDLPSRCRPHRLSGAYAGLWECHIEPDWLLIYDVTEKEVRLYRTGTHADLFE